MSKKDEETKILAKSIVHNCVRQTYLEELHRGKFPVSETGDYSDVKVVYPSGEIPWNNLARLNDAEMKVLIKQVFNRVYTYLKFIDEGREGFVDAMAHNTGVYTKKWDEPEIDQDFEDIGKKKFILK